MAYPIDDLTTTSLDAGTDDPSAARPELLALAQKVQAMLANTGTGNAYVLLLDSNGDIPSGVNFADVLGVGVTPVTGVKGHIHRANSTSNYLKFTNATTGAALGDGLDIGINSLEEAAFTNLENTRMYFSTNDIARLNIAADGGVYTTNATGGSQGVDSYNAVNYFKNGVNTDIETTWTPVLSDGTNTATSVIASGNEIKQGNMVFAQGYLSTSSLGSVSGAIRITGLTYPASSAVSLAAISVSSATGLNLTASETVSGYVNTSTGDIYLTVWNSQTGTSAMQATEWSADGQISFSVTYITG